MKTKIVLAIIVIVTFACNNVADNNPIVTQETTSKTSEKETLYINKGKEIAKNTFKVLGGNLKKALAEGGVENAISYCSVNAFGLTDSLSTYYNATIKRTSHKLRNESNSPTTDEQAIIDKYLLQASTGEELKPTVKQLDNGKTVFYAPIKIKSLCLTCHGTVGTTISTSDYAFINKNYPNDRAIDFKEGDFRGIWSITFDK